MSTELQRDIDEISRFVSQCGWQGERAAWQRLKPRLTPDREALARAIYAKTTWHMFGPWEEAQEHVRAQCLWHADAAIAAMGETP